MATAKKVANTGKNKEKKAGGLKSAESNMNTYTHNLQTNKMTYEKQANKALKVVNNLGWNPKNNANYKNAQNYINQYANRNKFSYDLNSDKLYQQYKDQYIRNAEAAMRDTVAQQNASNGGYGSSYAGVAAQQQYQRNLANLNEVVPQLYESAYNKYQDEGQRLMNSANAYQSQYANDKEAYDTKLGRKEYVQGVYENRKQTLENTLGNALQANRDYALGKKTNNRDFKYNKGIDARNFAYQKERDDKADALARAQLAASRSRSSGGSGSKGSSKGYSAFVSGGAKKGQMQQTVFTTQMGSTTVPVYAKNGNLFVKNGSDFKKVSSDMASSIVDKYQSGAQAVLDYMNADGEMMLLRGKSKLTKTDKAAINNKVQEYAGKAGINIGSSQKAAIVNAYSKNKAALPNLTGSVPGSKVKATAKKAVKNKTSKKQTKKK